MEGILSIQSAVAYGHVGNSAAVFPLQRLGFEAWPVNTVLFSNHTGYGAWRGHAVGVEEVREILKGVEERGAYPRTRAVVSGYLGDAALGEAVLDAVAAVRRVRPEALYACDPVMGDVGRGFFVKEGIPAFFKDHAVPAADIVTPNQFELAHLAGFEIFTLADALNAAAAVRAMGPGLVLCTSLMVEETGSGLGLLADTADGAWLVTTPHLPIDLSGTGDVCTALTLAYWLRFAAPAPMLEAVAGAMYGLVEATQAAGSRELLLVEAQDCLVEPRMPFGARRLR
ncbi:MAG: pyridoxal kinase PdxY [Geminicoccaceae bacterium]|nr:pyridoxal kinase PdxY [Geminicoccaceae bacterium]